MNTGIGCLFLVQPLPTLGSLCQAPRLWKMEPTDTIFISGGVDGPKECAFVGKGVATGRKALIPSQDGV